MESNGAFVLVYSIVMMLGVLNVVFKQSRISDLEEELEVIEDGLITLGKKKFDDSTGVERKIKRIVIEKARTETGYSLLG